IKIYEINFYFTSTPHDSVPAYTRGGQAVCKAIGPPAEARAALTDRPAATYNRACMRRVFEPWEEAPERPALPLRRVGWGALLLTLALGAGVICARAALGRTGSWSFPIDDAYIYGNYVLNAAQGRLLQYNPGEPSGGVTGPGWFLLLWAAYALTAP